MAFKNVDVDASDALLDIGVSIPLFQWRVPWTQKYVSVRLTMRRPTLSSQIRIAKKYMTLGTTYEQMAQYDKDAELRFLAAHGKTISEMVALTICRGKWGWLYMPIVAWLLRHVASDKYLYGANLHFVSLMGTKHFMSIIRSAEWSNPMKPRLSQKKTGS